MMRSISPIKSTAWRPDVRFLLDENVIEAVYNPLIVIFDAHEFSTVHRERWAGLHDIPLFEKMTQHGFDALITHDMAQLANPDERNSLRDHGLHWIGVKPQRFKGVKGISLETATVVAALPYVLDDLSTLATPTAFHVIGLPSEPSQRVRAETI